MSSPAASPVRWKEVNSSCIARIGYDGSGAYAEFRQRGAQLYRFEISRQRAVAWARSKSPGAYYNAEIAGRYEAWLIATREEN